MGRYAYAPRMAKLGWIGSVGLAVGASAGAAAAQFGLGYGLGIISWSPSLTDGPTTPDNVWLSSLAWTLWIAATSTVVGAICADRMSAGEIGAAPPRANGGQGDPTPPSGLATSMWRALLAVSAAVGASLSVALVLVPARAALRSDTATPQLIAVGYAAVGIIVGILIAVGALVARAAATNVLVTASWLWLLAIATVIDGVVVGRGLGTAPLGVWPFGGDTYFRSTFSLPGALLMLGVALIIGVGAAWRAAVRGDSRIGTSLSGALGPLLVAIAYFLTVPRLVGLDDPQFSAYLLAPYALIAGLTGSVLFVAALASREASRANSTGGGRRGFGRGRGRSIDDEATESLPVRIPLATTSKVRGRKTPPQPATVPATASASVPAPATPRPTGRQSAGSAQVTPPSAQVTSSTGSQTDKPVVGAQKTNSEPTEKSDPTEKTGVISSPVAVPANERSGDRNSDRTTERKRPRR